MMNVNKIFKNNIYVYQILKIICNVLVYGCIGVP